MSLEKNFQPGKGTKYEIGSPLQVLKGVKRIVLPKWKRDQIDFTGNDDTNEEFVNAPLETSDEYTLEINYDPADTVHNWLIANRGTRQDKKVTTKDKAGADKWIYTYDVNIAAVEIPAHGVNEAATLHVTFRPTGPITRAAAGA